MSDNRRFNVPPGDDFSDTPPAEIIQTEYVTPEEAALNEMDELLASTELDYSAHIEKPPQAISYKGVRLGSLGDFSLIYGKAKSKKTFTATMMMAAALSGSWGGFTGHLPEGKNKVIFIDTEQSKYDSAQTAKRVTRLIGHTGLHDRYKVYQLRKHVDPKDRVRLIDAILERNQDAGLVVIDGARDLMSNINDPDQSTEAVGHFLRWTDTYNCHIITILHQNKGDKNARGHLGSELINKCETAITVELDPHDKKVSKVEVSDSRGLPFDPFAFRVNTETALPEMIEGWTPTVSTGPDKPQAKPRPSDLDPLTNYNILAWAKKHTDGKSPTYNELLDVLREAIKEKTGHLVGDSVARQYFTHYKTIDGHISQHTDGKGRGRSRYYTIELPPAPGGTQSKEIQGELIADKMHEQDPF